MMNQLLVITRTRMPRSWKAHRKNCCVVIRSWMSTTCRSAENRLRIRPSGVTSKKEVGDPITAEIAARWRRRPARMVAVATTTTRSQIRKAAESESAA